MTPVVWSFVAGGFVALLLARGLARWCGVGSERHVRKLERALRCQAAQHEAEITVLLAELDRRTRELGASEEKSNALCDAAERLLRERRSCPFREEARDERRA